MRKKGAESEASVMEDRYKHEMVIWSRVSVNIAEVRHGLLIKRAAEELFENSCFLFVCGRSGTVQIEDTPYVLKTNILFHVGSNQTIRLDAAGGELEYFAVAYRAELPPNAGRELVAEFVQASPFIQTVSVRVRNSSAVNLLFLEITDVWNTREPSGYLQAKKCFYQILCSFYGERVPQETPEAEIDIFAKVRQYIQENFSERNMVEHLASSLCVTRTTLHDQFRKNIGISPQQYIMQLRLDCACRALSNTRTPIDEIAACCGLRDKSYLSRVFKQKYGMTPGEYRKRYTLAQNPVHGMPQASPLFQSENKANYILIENFGRLHRYYGIPRRIVCLDYSAAEICAALGVADRIVGVASAESSLADCAVDYQKEIAMAPFLPGRSLDQNVPDFSSVCDCKPDLVIGSAYSFDARGGIAGAEDFEKRGLHIYALKATYVLNSTFEDTYEDIRNLGRILGVAVRAGEIISDMRTQEKELLKYKETSDKPLRFFSFDSHIAGKAFTCGQSLESYMISSAGGENIFADKARQFVSVEWAEVAAANPQAILIHCFHDAGDGERKMALLHRISELADTEAMKNNRIMTLGIKKLFPGIDNIKTAIQLAKWIRTTSQGLSDNYETHS